jgi:hypothetical protein
MLQILLQSLENERRNTILISFGDVLIKLTRCKWEKYKMGLKSKKKLFL